MGFENSLPNTSYKAFLYMKNVEREREFVDTKNKRRKERWFLQKTREERWVLQKTLWQTPPRIRNEPYHYQSKLIEFARWSSFVGLLTSHTEPEN
jgi:hypothetical protein